MKAAVKHSLHAKPRVYRDRQLSQIAFPLGGIGTGTVSLGGRGNLQDWELFNRPSKGLTLHHAFFAIWARVEGKRPMAAVLEAEPAPPYTGKFGFNKGSVPSLPRLQRASFNATYPFARLTFSDENLPVRASLEAYSPFVPLKDIDSGLPGAIFLWTLTNPGKKQVEASVAFSMLNPVGLDGSENVVELKHPAFGGNLNELLHEQHFWAIHMTSERYQVEDVRHGSVALGTLWPKVSAVTRWPRMGGWGMWDLKSLWEDFSEDGTIKGPTDAIPAEQGRSEQATLCALLKLAPGESLTVPFLLTWNFPSRVNDWNSEPQVRGKVIRNYYTTWFKDALAVMKYLAQEYERLQRETRAFERAMYTSTLPWDVLESVGNQLVTLRSNTCFRDEEGRFFGFEGCGNQVGCCPLNCSHVWNYAQALPYLFPELERSMRETDFLVNTRPSGDMAFRTLVPIAANVVWDYKPAADGQMGTIMRLYRDWQICGDEEFLRGIWPKVRQALEFAWNGPVASSGGAWDADRDGLMEGEQHNTYDIEFYGPNPLTTILYLGALRAGEEMAQAVGETVAAQEYRRVFELGSRKVVEKLWNGEYFAQIEGNETERANQFGQGCLADQLLGQWMAHISGLGYLLPERHVHRAIAAVYKHNFKPTLQGVVNTARVFAHRNEGGVLVCTWPRGGRPKAPFPYVDEVWTGIEYQVAAHLIYEGLVEEGLRIVSAVRARHDGERRNPYNEPECGDHYARGLSSWSLLLALSGFRWSGPEATLRFVPAVPSNRFRSFFCNGVAWGVAEEGRSGKRALVSFRVEGGILNVRRLRLSPTLVRLERCWVEPSKTFLRGSMERRKGETQVEFSNAVQLNPGQALVLSFSR